MITSRVCLAQRTHVGQRLDRFLYIEEVNPHVYRTLHCRNTHTHNRIFVAIFVVVRLRLALMRLQYAPHIRTIIHIKCTLKALIDVDNGLSPQ